MCIILAYGTAGSCTVCSVYKNYSASIDASQSSILEHIYADGAVVVVATLAVEVVVALLGDPVDVTPVGAFVVHLPWLFDACGALVVVEDDVVGLQSTAHVYFEVTFLLFDKS